MIRRQRGLIEIETYHHFTYRHYFSRLRGRRVSLHMPLSLSYRRRVDVIDGRRFNAERRDIFDREAPFSIICLARRDINAGECRSRVNADYAGASYSANRGHGSRELHTSGISRKARQSAISRIRTICRLGF